MNTAFIKKYKLHHLLFWVLLYALWHFFRFQDYRANGWLVTLIKLADLALWVYLTNYVLVPRLLYRKKYLAFGVVLTLMIFAGSVLKTWVLSKVMGNPAMFMFSGNFKLRFYDNFFPHFLLVSTGAAFKFMYDYMQSQQKLSAIAKEKAETELQFLKSQLNPHFLFNSINSVYFLIDKENKAARESLHKFSELLRYQLYESNGRKLPVEREIKFLEDYMALQQLRLNGGHRVRLAKTPAVAGFAIEPLLLTPLVENAFKHVSHNVNGGNFIDIDMDFNGTDFMFRVHNSRENGAVSKDGHGGIGLQNVRRRLQLLYPGKHDLKIQEGKDDYEVALQLQIAD